jgi:hypothetical protein
LIVIPFSLIQCLGIDLVAEGVDTLTDADMDVAAWASLVLIDTKNPSLVACPMESVIGNLEEVE